VEVTVRLFSAKGGGGFGGEGGDPRVTSVGLGVLWGSREALGDFEGKRHKEGLFAMAEQSGSPSRSAKEGIRLVIEGLKADLERRPKWVAVGRVLMERQVNAASLERCMTRA
jgi:hypothetical protein